MGSVSIQQMADRVAQLMEERLRIRGQSLTEKVARGGRHLPRRVRAAAAYLSEASELAKVPKLNTRLDHARIAEAYDACVTYLRPLGAGQRRRTALLNFVTNLAAVVVLTAALVIAVLVWRGYV